MQRINPSVPNVCFGDQRLPVIFWQKTQPIESGCWIWIGATSNNGYGNYKTSSGLTRPVHRLAYEALVGRIGSHLVIDHLCRTRCCVNPSHLEPVSQKENVLRGENHAAKYSSRTRCKSGHEFTGNNTYIYAKEPGARQCRECRRNAYLKWSRSS